MQKLTTILAMLSRSRVTWMLPLPPTALLFNSSPATQKLITILAMLSRSRVI